MNNNEILARWQGWNGRYRCTVDGSDCGECVVDDPNHDINDCDIAPTLSNKTACQYWVNDMDYLPDYLNDDADADALSLIPFLVKEKGYSVSLDYIEGKGWWFEASLDGYRCGVQSSFQDTLAKAVVEVVLVLIEKEEQT